MTGEPATTTASDDADLRRLAAFAVMTVDWSSQRRSYLDNFLNYALAVLPTNSPTAIARDAVRPLIIERFNLRLPANIVQQLLRRATKLGYLAVVGDMGIALTDKGRREVSPIPYTLKKLAQEQVAVSVRLAQWAADEVGLIVDQGQATAMILDYVQTYYCSLMSISEAEGGLRFPAIEPSPEQKVTAAFIAAMQELDEELFESIANMARGSMMVNALYAPKLVDTTSGFKRTTIYLDTKIVLRVLGYEGEAAQQSTNDLLSVLSHQDARLGIFDFTLREIRSVLDAVAGKARGGRIWDSRPGSVESYFYRQNASNAQIEQHSVRVESRILGLGIHVDPSPAWENHRFVIDESAVEAALLAGNPNYRSTALQHDVELICAIVRARSGRARESLEESRATFATLNSLVVSTARAVQREYHEPWPLAMFETDIAALTWIKEPLAAPNLPKAQLLATSLGLTNPGRHDWGLYIGEISKLLESDQITDNDIILLRQKYEMDRLAFVTTSASTSDADKRAEIHSSIELARQAVTEELTAPIRLENTQLESSLHETRRAVDEKAAEADAKAREAAASKEEADTILRAHLKGIWSRGQLVMVGIRGGLATIGIAALLATIVPGAEKWLWATPLGAFFGVIIWAAALATVFFGGLWGPIVTLAARQRERYILSTIAKAKITPERAATVGYVLTKHHQPAAENNL